MIWEYIRNSSDISELDDILLGDQNQRKKVMLFKRQGLTDLAVSNKGETDKKLILNMAKTYPQ